MAEQDRIIINEAQLVLAEQRTHLATLRTGLALLALPMSVVSFLIVASRYYHFRDQLGLIVPLLMACAGLAGLGVYLFWRSWIKLRRAERVLEILKQSHTVLSQVLD